jgi:hypothetical protein
VFQRSSNCFLSRSRTSSLNRTDKHDLALLLCLLTPRCFSGSMCRRLYASLMSSATTPLWFILSLKEYLSQLSKPVDFSSFFSIFYFYFLFWGSHTYTHTHSHTHSLTHINSSYIQQAFSPSDIRHQTVIIKVYSISINIIMKRALAS